jgi:hypothetical protein
MNKAKRCWWSLGVTVAVLSGLAVSVPADTYTGALTAGQNKNWSDPTAWNPSTGVPGSGDDVTLNSIAWPNGWQLNLNAGWGANSLTINAADGNNLRLELLASGTIGALNFNRTTASAYSHAIYFASTTTLTLTELNETGLRPWRFVMGGNRDQVLRFVGDAKIRYVGNGGQGGTEVTQLGMGNDFSGATSVWLGQYNTSLPLLNETLQQQDTQNSVNSLILGRTDNGLQTWTVQSGNHPLVSVYSGTGRQSIQKVGAGDVNMAGVDLRLDVRAQDGAIAGNGSGWWTGDPYAGTITANSFIVDASVAGAYRRFGIGGRLVLDGQSGLQAGGAGTGHAFTAIAGNYDLEVYLRTGQWSVGNLGPLEIAPGGGDIFLTSTGAGGVEFNISQAARDNDKRVGLACVKAQTFNIAGPNSFITDKERNGQPEARWGGQIEFSGSFLNQSTRNVDFRLDHSTLRALGYGMFEAPSADLGLAGPGASNYGIGSLVLGRDAVGTTDTTAWLMLQDVANNAPGGGGEALYVDSLLMFNGSILELRGLNLYYKNSGTWALATPGAFTLNGSDGVIVVPEPAALALLAMGGLVLGRRRGRR